MAQKRNAQTVVINSSATLINVANPSSTAFMYVWGLSVGANAACNVAFQNGPSLVGGYQTLATGSPLVYPPDTIDPIFTCDPNQNFVVSNPNAQLLGGWVRVSN